MQIDFTVFGRVQHVWYRRFVRQRLSMYNLSGYAQNNPDGSVYVLAEGEKVQLEKLIRDCYKGPVLAKVNHIEFGQGLFNK